MTETPDPEEQNQEQPEAAADRVPASPADTADAQNGSTPPAADEATRAGTDEQVPAGEQEDADLEEGRKPQPAGPNQAEAIRRKERLEKQARWQAEASSEQERAFNQRANQRRIEFDRRQVGLRHIEESDLRQNEQLFVPPEGYQEFVERIEQSTGAHILIVTGPEHSGKLTTAIYLAHHLWRKKAPDVFLFTDLSIKTLLNVVADEQLPGNAVLLFDEVFDRKQLMVDDLVNRYAHLKEDLIDRGNVWFLFTVLPGPHLNALAASNFPILDTSTVDREQVLEKLIDFFFPAAFGNQRTMLLEAKAELNPDLTPPDLYNLFEVYRQNVPLLCKELTKKLTKEEKEEQERQLAPDRWFQDLPSMNYQLYALLVVLFEKLDIPMLEEIYTEAVNALRQQGMDSPEEFIDPRRIGTSLMHQALGIRERFQVLEFRHHAYRQYVEEQVGNFQRLLWSLIDADDPSTFSLVSLIHELSEYDFRAIREGRYSVPNEQLWQLRHASAAMIAQVGVYHLNKLDQLLDKFVSDESPLVSLTVTFVLAELAQRDKFDFVETLLKAWTKSGRFEQMWVAAASISVIYTAIADPLEDQMEEREPDEQEKEEDEEEKKTETTREQKSSGKGRLAKLRELLTELVKVHTQFSKGVINERRSQLDAMYRARLRQYLEADSEPLPDKERLFRDLSESEQDEYFHAAYLESKKSIDEAIQRDIALLLASWVDQMRMVLMQTLGNIAQTWPRDVTRMVRVWLDRKDTESPLWQIGHMALNFLFRESSTIKDASRLQQSAYPLLDLLPMAMHTHKLTMEVVLHDVNLFLQIDAFQETGSLAQHLEVGNLLRGDPLISALSAIQQWYEHVSELAKRQEPKKEEKKAAAENEEEDEEVPADEVVESVPQKRWQEAVYAVLSNSMNSAPQEERQRLRWALFLWIKSGEQMLGHIARILISHSYVMDGGVLDLPGSKRAGIVVLDNTRKDQEDRERIFYLLQRLSSIAPLRLHWLGYTRGCRLLSSEDRKETGQIHNARKIFSLDPDDLLLRGASRPALLLPVLLSGQGQGYVPERSYFVAVFHNGPILDLDDFYPGRVGSSEQPVSTNIFGDLLRNRKAASPAHRQPWQGKVYLLPSSEKFVIDATLSPFLRVVYPENFGLIEEELRQQVTLTLRSCSAEELWQDLRTSIGVPETQPRTFERLAREIELWLEQLADTSKLYPDVSLFILWTIMACSRENLAEALQLIELLLPEKPEGEEDKAAKKVRKLRQQMGIACARMLFHFYGSSNPGLSSTEYGSLLRLLPQVIACANSYTEILPMLSVLFQLAWTNDWLQLLNEQDGALFECISRVAARDLKPLRNWLTYHQYWLAMIRLFLEYDKPFNEFRAFGETVFQRYKVPQPKQSGRGSSKEGNASPGEQASKFLAILPATDAQEEKDRYDWALQQIAFQETRLRSPDARTDILTGLQNLEILLAHLASELQTRLDGTIERLKEGETYGVVLVEAQNKTAARQAFLFVQEFAKQRKESKRQHLTLMIQRLGEKEVLAKVRNNRKLKNEREISDKRKRLQVVGPLLERYPADQVAFVLMITADPIIDYDDWAEQEQWVSRLWVSRLGKWHPYHGEIADLKDGMQLTLETLFNRSEGEKDNDDYVSLLPDHAGTAANQSVQ